MDLDSSSNNFSSFSNIPLLSPTMTAASGSLIIPRGSSNALPPFDSTSPSLLPRRSPRLSSRPSFSPSPNFFSRTLSMSSPNKKRGSVAGLGGEDTFLNDTDDNVWDRYNSDSTTGASPSLSTSMSSQSTPTRSTPPQSDRGGARIGGTSEPTRERNLGDENEKKRLRVKTALDSHNEDNNSVGTGSATHSRHVQSLSQQLLRAASHSSAAQQAAQTLGAFTLSQINNSKEENNEDPNPSTPDKPSPAVTPAPGSHPHTDDGYPPSSSCSVSSAHSYPSVSSSESLEYPSRQDDRQDRQSVEHPETTEEEADGDSTSSLSLIDPVTGKKRRVVGQSCHQCKTRRLAPDLVFCAARHMKKGRARKKKKERVCRKKYCARCLNKFYGESVPPLFDANGEPYRWTCPGCRDMCSCAACKRHKKEEKERKGKAAGGKKRKDRMNGDAVKATPLEKPAAATVVSSAEPSASTAMAAPIAAPLSRSSSMAQEEAVPVSVSVPISGTGQPPIAMTIDDQPPGKLLTGKHKKGRRGYSDRHDEYPHPVKAEEPIPIQQQHLQIAQPLYQTTLYHHQAAPPPSTYYHATAPMTQMYSTPLASASLLAPLPAPTTSHNIGADYHYTTYQSQSSSSPSNAYGTPSHTYHHPPNHFPPNHFNYNGSEFHQHQPSSPLYANNPQNTPMYSPMMSGGVFASPPPQMNLTPAADPSSAGHYSLILQPSPLNTTRFLSSTPSPPHNQQQQHQQFQPPVQHPHVSHSLTTRRSPRFTLRRIEQDGMWNHTTPTQYSY